MGAQSRPSKQVKGYSHADAETSIPAAEEEAELHGADIMHGTVTHLTTLPAEILLSVIETLPLDRQTLRVLQLTHPGIRDLVKKFERSITMNNSKAYMRHATTDFPWNADKKAGYAWLFRTMDRYDLCDSVMVVLTSPFVCHNVQSFNQCAILTGLYLLYRVLDFGESLFPVSFVPSIPSLPSPYPPSPHLIRIPC